MAQVVQKYWQLAVYLLSLSFGVGLTVAVVRASAARLEKIEAHGTPTAQNAERQTVDLDKRVTVLENQDRLNQKMLERIDERTEIIMRQLNNLEMRNQ